MQPTLVENNYYWFDNEIVEVCSIADIVEASKL